MSQNIYHLYRNKTAIAFMWQEPKAVLQEKIQIIFRDIGFYFSNAEIKDFYNCIQQAKEHASLKCDQCNFQNKCRYILLQTPTQQVDLAVNETELFDLEDLINGTLFRIDLEHYLANLCNN